MIYIQYILLLLRRQLFVYVLICWTLILVLRLQGKQSSRGAEPNTATGQALYTRSCSGCHGIDARGTDQGPALVGNNRVRARSIQNLRELIRTGIPRAGMPAFYFSGAQLEDVAAFVHSLNAPAADSTLRGDPGPGERFFFGEGHCGNCHMVYGRGRALGPDLSDAGRKKTVDELRADLTDPNEHISPGYQAVTLHLRNGDVLRGFVRGESNFDIRLQDFEGHFRFIEKREIVSLEKFAQAVMPPVQASPEQLSNLMIYLGGLRGVQAGSLAAPGSMSRRGIEFSRILKPEPGDWLTYHGKLSANRYSDLTQINRTNVNALQVSWNFSIPLWREFYPDTPYFVQNLQTFGLEVTPLVADGVMYVTGPNSAFALDARTGGEIWEYSRERTPGLVGDASLGTNRGVAILGDNVYMVTDNAHLLALNRTTGHVFWEQVMPQEPQHYGSTIAPLIVNDLVIAGVSGGDWGMRGFVIAYKAATGERLWRHWTVPARGEPGIETWRGNAFPAGGGATWLTGSYDPETDTLYWPTGNPYPDSDDRERGGDNLYTDCILALSPETGALKWYYQFTPHDTYDWDATEPPVLIDTLYRGQNRKLLLLANRNGFFYVLDRTNGKVLLAKSFLKHLTWASGIGADGRPQLLPESDVVCPDEATNWNATAFSPVTRLYYVMAYEKCDVSLRGRWNKQSQEEEEGQKFLRALNIETGNIVWEAPQIGPAGGKRIAGVLATAGGLIFYGDPSGDFVAADERDGKPLWHFRSNEIYKASPMTYEVNGKQYVAIAAGSNITSFALQ